MPPIIWVENSAEFLSLCTNWMQAEYLAIDTEFERRTTYYPILALLQIFDGQQIYIIDPKQVECNQQFRDICCDPEIVKIMHSAKEDLEVLLYSWQCHFDNLFDTQVAHTFVTGENALGYANLVEKFTGIKLSKDATQSDWLARPLAPNQLDYAAKDVFYLPQIYRQLVTKLEGKSFNKYFLLECRDLCLQAEKLFDPETGFRQAKEVWRLKGAQLNRFRRLYNWREETAVSENRSRNHLLKDPQLVQIAMLNKVNRRALQSISGVHPKSIRLYGEKLASVAQQDEYDSQQEIKPVLNPRDVPKLKSLTSEFTAMTGKIAQQFDLDSLILMSKRQLRKVAYSYLTGETFPDFWNGWRGTLLKPDFDHIFSQYST